MAAVHQLFLCLMFNRVPRLNYLRNRVLSLYPRFQNIMKVYPDYLRYDDTQGNLDTIYRSLDSGSTDVLVLSNDDATFKPFLEPSTKTTLFKKVLVLCVASINMLDRAGRQVVLNLLLTEMSPKVEINDVIIICVTHASLLDTKINKFKDALVQELPLEISRYCSNICIINHTQTISAEVETIYSKRITDILLEMYNIVKFYVRNEYLEKQSLDVINTESAHTMVKDYLKNAYSMSCFDCHETNTEVLVERIARVLRCAWIAPAALKHAVPPYVINAIMYDMNVEESLLKSFTSLTRNRLSRLKRNASSLLKTSDTDIVHNCERLSKQYLHQTDKLYNTLLSDSKNIFNKIEDKISTIQNHVCVFRKLLLEIRGYIHQSGNKHFADVTGLIADAIPTGLRKDILSMNGVYGVGTVYGQLEIHLNISTDDKSLTDQIKELIQRHRYGYGTRIKHIKPKTIVTL